MRYICFIVAFCFYQSFYAQFTFMRHSKKYPNLITLVMNDGSERKGYVKNNEPQDVVLRLLSSDLRSLVHANVIANTIKFQPEGQSSFQEIASTSIKKIIFTGEENVVLDRITVREFKRKNQEIKDKESFNVFQEALYENEVFKVYGTIYLNIGEGGHVMDQFRFFVKEGNQETAFIFPFTGAMHWTYQFKYFKIFGKNNPRFNDYIDKLSSKKSQEYKDFIAAYKESFESAKEEFKELRKTSKDVKSKDERIYITSAKYNFLFGYMGHQYKTLLES